MYESIYRQAMTKAWYLVWHNKILWILGLLSVMVGQFGVGDFVGKLLYWNDQTIHPFYVFSYAAYLLGLLPHSFMGTMGVLWALILTFLVIALFVFVAVSAQGALVAVVADWYKSKKADKLMVAWHKGVKHFWRVLAINILAKVAFGVLLFLLGWAISIFGQSGFFSLLLLGVIFAVVILLAFAVAAITVYSIGFVVAEDSDLFNGFSRGWQLFMEHLLVSMELAILLFMVGWIILALAFLISFIVFLPSAALWLLGGAVGSAAIMWIGLAVGLILLAVMWVLSGALFNAFTVSVWIYCFMKMKHTGIVSRLGYGVEKLFRRG